MEGVSTQELLQTNIVINFYRTDSDGTLRPRGLTLLTLASWTFHLDFCAISLQLILWTDIKFGP